MKTIRNISAFILSALFLASSSGIIIFYAHCVCSGEKQVSVFVMTDPYEVNFDIHHTEDQGAERFAQSVTIATNLHWQMPETAGAAPPMLGI